MRKLLWAAVIPNLCVTLYAKDVIWTADFESYTAGQNVTINGSGSNDTFSGIFTSNPFNPTAWTFTNVGAGTYTGFNTGNAGLLRINPAPLNQLFGPETDHFSPAGQNGGVWILSFDVAIYGSTSARNYGLGNISTDSGNLSVGSGATPTSNGSGEDVRRITVVINRTGSKITLPFDFPTNSLPYDADSPDAVNPNSVFMYQRYGNGNYLYNQVNGDDIPIDAGQTGEGIDGFRIWGQGGVASVDLQFVFDNFIVLTDPAYHTAGGVNILAAMPGTQPFEFIPEPSTIFMLGLGSLPLWIRKLSKPPSPKSG